MIFIFFDHMFVRWLLQNELSDLSNVFVRCLTQQMGVVQPWSSHFRYQFLILQIPNSNFLNWKITLSLLQYLSTNYKRQKIIEQMTLGKLKLKTPLNGNSISKARKQKNEQAQMQKIFSQKLKTKDKITTFEPKQGTGTIVTSGTTLIGQNTKFKQQVQNGDSIVVENPLLKTKQQRQVMVVLGEKSILLKQPFVEDIVSMTSFIIQKKAKVEKGQDIAQDFKKKVQDIKKTKTITKDTIDLRIKKGMWGYETEKVEVSKNSTKESLLDIRAKKIKDKHCW